MHEMAVAENIIKVVEEKLVEQDRKGTVTRINLKIGKLTCVEPEALKLSFEVISQETPFQKACLIIDSIPITGRCNDCHKNFSLDDLEFTCPFCGSFKIEIKTGKELFIESFEIE
jgi:hydrogenase nickel incorporation protein HypA/HybF